MPTHPASPATYRSAAAVVTMVFFMLGFITCLNDILIPHLRSAFSLNFTQAMLVQSAFFGAYLLMSIPAGKIVALVGYKGALGVGLLISAVGAVLFYPAAGMQSYGVFLAALFILATGVTIQQVAFNPYMALLGPERTASSRMNLAHAFNSLGTLVAPHFGGIFILSSTLHTPSEVSQMEEGARRAWQLSEAQSTQLPYLGIAAALVILALVILFWRMPRFNERKQGGSQAGPALFAPLRARHMRLAVVAIFVYVGAEVSIGSFMINYLSHEHIGGITHKDAAFYLSLYWGGAMVGRFIGAALMRFTPAGRLLGIFAMAAAALVLLSLSTSGAVAMWSILAVGLFNSIMFPTIFSLAVAGLREMSAQVSTLISMAIVGGAVVPVLQGQLADHFGLQPAFILPVLCYLYITYYGFVGSKPDLGKVT